MCGCVIAAIASRGRIDGVAVAWRRADAIDANLKFRKLEKQTLSQHRQVALQIYDIELHAQLQEFSRCWGM